MRLVSQDFAWNNGDFVTWTLDTPVLLSPNTTYGIDVGMTSSTSSWQTGIPYINTTGKVCSNGAFYTSDPNGKVLFVFRRSVAANGDSNTNIEVEYGDTLNGWITASHQGTAANEITINVNPVQPEPGFDEVTVALPAGLAGGDKLFARLKVVFE